MATVFVTGATGVLGRATDPAIARFRLHRKSPLSRRSERCRHPRPRRRTGARRSVRPGLALPRGRWRGCHPPSRHADSAQLRYAAAAPPGSRTIAFALKARRTSSMPPSRAGARGSLSIPASPSSIPIAATRGSTPYRLPSLRPTSCTVDHCRRASGRALRGEGGRRGVSLRLGFLYGSDLPSTREQLQLARRGVSMFGSVPAAFTPSALDRRRRVGSRRRARPRSVRALMTSSTTSRSGNGSSRPHSPRPRGGAECCHSHSGSCGSWPVRQRRRSPEACVSPIAASARRPGGRRQVRDAVEGMAQVERRESSRPDTRVPATVRLGLWAWRSSASLRGSSNSSRRAPSSTTFRVRYAMGCGRWTVQRAPAARSRRCKSFARRGHPLRDSPAHGGTRPRSRGGDARRSGSALHLPRRAPRGAADDPSIASCRPLHCR